jgi:hypothetical protein
MTLPPGVNAATVTGHCLHLVARLHGFDPFRSPFIHHKVLPKRCSRYSPGVNPLQGVLPLRLRGRLHILFLLRTFWKNLSEESFLTLYLRVSKNEEVGLSRETADLHGVFALGAFLDS